MFFVFPLDAPFQWQLFRQCSWPTWAAGRRFLLKIIVFFEPTMAKTECSPIFFSEVLFALVKITFVLCISVAWTISMRVPLAVLLVYVGCWGSISVGNYIVYLTLICSHVMCAKMNFIYDDFWQCCCGLRNTHFPIFIHCFSTYHLNI